MGDIKKLGRIGTKTMAFYLSTTAVAIIIALFLGSVLKPGAGLGYEPYGKWRSINW